MNAIIFLIIGSTCFLIAAILFTCVYLSTQIKQVKFKFVNAFSIRCDLEALVCEREGMVIDNRLSERMGKSFSYSGHHFAQIGADIQSLSFKYQKAAL